MEVYSHATAAMQDYVVTALDEFYRHSAKKAGAVSGQISGQTANGEANDQNEDSETLTG